MTLPLPLLLTRRAVLAGAAGLAVAAQGWSRPAAAAPAIGAAAPDFTLPDQDGATRRLAEARGRVVVLEWTNHDCPYVQKHYGAANMQALQREAASLGAVWYSVISSAPGEQGHVAPARAKALTIERNAAPAGVLLDPEGRVGQAYAARTTPHMYVIGPDGLLRYMGGIDDVATARVEDLARARPLLREALRAVAAGRPVEQASTRPYGCSIKYAA